MMQNFLLLAINRIVNTAKASMSKKYKLLENKLIRQGKDYSYLKTQKRRNFLIPQIRMVKKLSLLGQNKYKAKRFSGFSY